MSEMKAKDFLRISTTLQTKLIRSLKPDTELSDLLSEVTACVHSESKDLEADACSVYLIDQRPTADQAGSASMRAASGYHKKVLGHAKTPIVDPDQVTKAPGPGEKLGLTGWVISTGRSFLAGTARELKDHPHWTGRHDTEQFPSKESEVHSILAVPLPDLRGDVIGALKVERLTTRSENGELTPFSVEDQLVLATLARVAGRCIAYAEEARERTVDIALTMWAREVIAEAVATEGELDAFLDIVVLAVAAATNADSCAIFLADENRRTLTQRAGCGSQVLRRVVRAYGLPEKGDVRTCVSSEECVPLDCPKREEIKEAMKVGLTAWVAATGKTFHARNLEDLKTHCHHRGKYDPDNYDPKQECGAWLGVPLRVGGINVGMLKVENVSRADKEDGRDFSSEDRRRLDLLAQEVALAIRRLSHQYRARYEILNRARPLISEGLRGEFNVPVLVRRITTKTAELFKARACALFLKEGNRLVQPPWAAHGWARRGPRVRTYDLVDKDEIVDDPQTEDDRVGLTVWIAVKREMFTAKSHLELASHPHHRGTFNSYNFDIEKQERCESFMGIPLVVGNKLLGVFKVETKMKPALAEEKGEKEEPAEEVLEHEDFAYFTELDELAFKLIADTVAIAIQNARLMAARNLAERLRNRPGASEVFSDLHELIQDGEDVRNTLSGAAEIVYNTQPDRAAIVRNVAALLDPEFDVQILHQLHQSLGGHFQNLLSAFDRAILVKDLVDLEKLINEESLERGAVLVNTFPMHRSAKALTRAYSVVGPNLTTFHQDKSVRDSLRTCQEHLTLDSRLITDGDKPYGDLNQFERNLLLRTFEAWSSLINRELGEFRPIRNPYVAGVPLQANSRVFFGRDSTFRWLEKELLSPGQGSVVVLHGGWHTGKTSILKQLEDGSKGRRLRVELIRPTLPIYVDLQRLNDDGAGLFLLAIADEIEKGLHRAGIPSAPTPDEAKFIAAPSRAFDKYWHQVEALIAGPPQSLLILMLDEFERLYDMVKTGKLDPGFFDYLRSLMQHEANLSFILAGRRTLDSIETEQKTKLYNVSQHREVAFLDRGETEDLVRQPVREAAVEYDDEVVERIWVLSGGHPYFIQQLCSFCVSRLNEMEKGYRVMAEHLDHACAQALQPANSTIFEDHWEQLEREERIVLTELAQQLTQKGGDATGEALAAGVERSDVSAKALRGALQKLQGRRLVVAAHMANGEPSEWRFTIDLMRLWIPRALVT